MLIANLGTEIACGGGIQPFLAVSHAPHIQIARRRCSPRGFVSKRGVKWHEDLEQLGRQD